MGDPLIDLSLIVAMTPQRVIGRNNEIPWRIPSDLNRFRIITQEIGTVVLGFKTYESILKRNGKLLPGRRHIVLSRSHRVESSEMLEPARTLEETFALLRVRATRACVIGGSQIYAMFMPYVRRMYITMVMESVPGDIYFPEPGPGWEKVRKCSPLRWHQLDEHPTAFDEYTRS